MQYTTSAAPTCCYCGAYHQGICPRVERMEYYPDGTVKQVWLRSMGMHPLVGEQEEPPVRLETGHICGVDCPQAVWGE